MTWNWPWKAGSVAVPEKKSGMGFVALHAAGEAHWTRRDYAALAREGFMQNPVVHRSVRLIAEAASAIPWLLYEGDGRARPRIRCSALLERPNQRQAGATFLEALYGHLLLSGNAYVEMISADGAGRRCAELHLLRPDRVTVVTDAAGWPAALEYRERQREAQCASALGGQGDGARARCIWRCSIRSTTTTASRRWRRR